MKVFNNLLVELENYVSDLELEYQENILIQAEKGIKEAKETLKKIRDLVIEKGFTTNEDEIYFFKVIKPKIYSKLIYYVKLFSIENKRPRGSSKPQIKYFNCQINKLQNYLNDNLDFYHYYRREMTIFDEYFFLRGKASYKLFPDSFHFFTDENFSTSHDSIVARILAYDLLIIYLKREIDKLENNTINPTKKKLNNIRWTGHKIDLIELIYALHSSGCVNHGKADIKDIASITERIFKIDLGDFYRAYLELRMRKKGRTKFLNILKESLEKRMDENDE